MFFYASKILWFCLQPSVLILAAIIGGALLTRRAQFARAGRRLFAGGLASLVLFGLTPVSLLLVAHLERRFARPDLASGPPVAGIIILGGAGNADVPERIELANLNEAGERYVEAVALARRLGAARVVFTGGAGNLIGTYPPESDLARRLLLALGIEDRRIVIEGTSRTTYENAVFTRDLVRPQPQERWLLVTSAWHMPRSIGAFRKAGFAVEPWPVDYRAARVLEPDLNVLEGLRRTDMVSKEYVGLIAYYLTGRSSALFPAP